MADVTPSTALLAPVLLTGATGFVGRRLQHALIERGYPVRALVRPGSRRLAGIAHGVEVVAASLDDPDALRRALGGAGAIIYCAGTVRGRSPEDFRAANVHGVRRVADANAALLRPLPLLLISSLAASRPQVSDYALTKREGEGVLLAHPRIPWTVLRPPALYGPGDVEMRPVLEVMRRGLVPVTGPRGQRISLLHVDDFAAAVLAWLADPLRTAGRTFELHDGTEGGYDWPAMGRAVAGREVRLFPVPGFLLRTAAMLNWLLSFGLRYAPMLTPGKARELRQPGWVADNRDFQAATGWAPKILLAEGAARLFGN
jgi:uncharacterized protein YbjT (DUF2867 family)